MKNELMITSDQTELTPEQLECAKEYARKKIAIYLSTNRESKKQVNIYALNAYKVAGVKLPKKVRWFKSPQEFSSVRDSVWDSVGGSVWDSVWDSVCGSVRDSVRGSVCGSVRDSVRGSVRDSVRGSVWGSVGGSVWDSVGGSVWDSVGAWYDADDWSYLGFFNDYFKSNKIVWLQKLSESVTGYYFWERECWLVEKPKTLDRNEDGRLHSVKGKAIEWRDGYGFYYIHGIEFDESLWKKVTSPKVHVKTILSLENIEQRMAAIKLVGVEKLLKTAKLIKKSKGYELYLIKDIFSTDAYYLKYTCPSTGRIYVSGIDPEVGKTGDPIECVAWKWGVSKEDYLGLEIQT